MFDYLTPELAAINIMSFAANDRLIQHDWHKGKEFACLLGAIHTGVSKPADCPAQVMPAWLAGEIPNMFDHYKGDINQLGMTFADYMSRWADVDWQHVLRLINATTAMAEQGDPILLLTALDLYMKGKWDRKLSLRLDEAGMIETSKLVYNAHYQDRLIPTLTFDHLFRTLDEVLPPRVERDIEFTVTTTIKRKFRGNSVVLAYQAVQTEYPDARVDLVVPRVMPFLVQQVMDTPPDYWDYHYDEARAEFEQTFPSVMDDQEYLDARGYTQLIRAYWKEFFSHG